MRLKIISTAAFISAVYVASAQDSSRQPAKYEFTAQQCIDFGIKNNLNVKNRHS
jgi:hypothetical protein